MAKTDRQLDIGEFVLRAFSRCEDWKAQVFVDVAPTDSAESNLQSNIMGTTRSVTSRQDRSSLGYVIVNLQGLDSIQSNIFSSM